MNKTFKLKSLLLSMAVAGAATFSVAPTVAQAEVSYNAAVSNMYLWRGQQISAASGVVSGGADYSHESGLYAGMWTSSEGAADSTEFDLYGGYAFTAGEVDLNIGYFAYFYPDAGGSEFGRDAGSFITEYMLSAGYGDFSATAFINTETDDADNYKYISLDYGIGAFGLHFGAALGDTDANEYTDVNVSYAATDALSFTVSKAQGDGLSDVNEKPMIQVSYSLPL